MFGVIFTFVLRDDPPIVWGGIIEGDDVCGDKGETGIGNANSTVGGYRQQLYDDNDEDDDDDDEGGVEGKRSC